jgi:hypothetical protein
MCKAWCLIYITFSTRLHKYNLIKSRNSFVRISTVVNLTFFSTFLALYDFCWKKLFINPFRLNWARIVSELQFVALSKQRLSRLKSSLLVLHTEIAPLWSRNYTKQRMGFLECVLKNLLVNIVLSMQKICFMWVWNWVSPRKFRTQVKSVWEHSVRRVCGLKTERERKEVKGGRRENYVLKIHLSTLLGW